MFRQNGMRGAYVKPSNRIRGSFFDVSGFNKGWRYKGQTLTTDKRIEVVACDLIREGFRHEFGNPTVPPKADAIWCAVRNDGPRLWPDTGDLEEAGQQWNEALTTNSGRNAEITAQFLNVKKS